MSFLLLILEFYKKNARLIINLFIELFDLKEILQFCKIKSENFLDLNLNLDLTCLPNKNGKSYTKIFQRISFFFNFSSFYLKKVFTKVAIKT